MIIHKCDRCGKTSEQKKGVQAKLPGDWFKIRFNVSGYGVLSSHYEICSDCRIALKIPEKDPDTHVGDQLIEIIEEIAQDAVAQ